MTYLKFTLSKITFFLCALLFSQKNTQYQNYKLYLVKTKATLIIFSQVTKKADFKSQTYQKDKKKNIYLLFLKLSKVKMNIEPIKNKKRDKIHKAKFISSFIIIKFKINSQTPKTNAPHILLLLSKVIFSPHSKQSHFDHINFKSIFLT